MKALIIIPAYNEEDNIESLVKDVCSYNYDYLVINDHSTDTTEDILSRNNFNHLNLPINLGIAGVTRVGFKYAYDHGYDCCMCIDGDGQHKPSYVEPILKKIEEGNDYVVGSRFYTEKKPFNIRMFGSRLICLFIRIKTRKKVTDPTSGMRALGRKVIEEFNNSMNFYAEPDALCYLIKNKYKVDEVQVEMNERKGGVSYFHNPLKSIYYMLSVLLSIIFIQ